MPRRALPDHTCRTETCRTEPNRSCHTTSHLATLCLTLTHRTAPRHTCRTLPNHALPRRAMPRRALPAKRSDCSYSELAVLTVSFGSPLAYAATITACIYDVDYLFKCVLSILVVCYLPVLPKPFSPRSPLAISSTMTTSLVSQAVTTSCDILSPRFTV